MHILPANLRSDAHRTFSTAVLRCSIFKQTALFCTNPVRAIGLIC